MARRESVSIEFYRLVSKALPAVRPIAGTRAAAAAPVPPQLIPDGCNLGVLLRVLLALLLGVAVVSAAGATTAVEWSENFLRASILVSLGAPATLLLWCLLRRVAGRWRAPAQRAIAWATPAVVVAASAKLLGADLWGVISNGLLGLAVGVATQHYLELRERAFSPAVAEARFQALQSRIRPHFLFNSLNAVLSIIRTDPMKAERMLEAIAELFRAVMADTRRLVPLADEIELCKSYVEIEQTRLGDRLQVEWNVGAYHPNAKVPQLLLQPILENAVRYGAERYDGACKIEVVIRQHGFRLEIVVSNPIAPDRPEREGNQMGLNNIRGRLALIYDLEAQLEARVRGDRFELKMVLPVERGT